MMLDADLPQVSLTHFLCQRADGTIWAAGNNERGQIGNGSTNGQPDLTWLSALLPDASDPSFSLVALNLDGDGGSYPGWVGEVAEQPDGKIIIGGSFDEVNGVRRSNVARIFPDGSVDASFSAPRIANLNGISVLSDAKLLISSGGGDAFLFEESEPPYLRRLLPNGSLDSSFSFQMPLLGPGRDVYAIYDFRILGDGKILVLGSYNQLADEVFGDFVVRVNANGSRDTSFPPRIFDGVDSLQLQADGKIILSGWQHSDEGQRFFLSRLTSSGVTDPTFGFLTAESEYLSDFAILPDGKVFIGGDPSNSWSGLALLSSSGQMEAILNPGPSLGYPGLAAHRLFLQADQSLRVFDVFQPYIYHVLSDGSTRDFQEPYAGLPSSILPDSSRYVFNYEDGSLIRCYPLPASGHVTIAKNRLEWLRGGAALEISNVTFELSTNNGSTWTFLGNGSRIGGGWGLSGISLPAAGRVRARGRAYHDNSSSLIEAVSDFY